MKTQAKADARWTTAFKRGAALGTGLTLCLTMAGLAQQVDRSKPPALGPVQPLALPAVTRHTLSNGLPVLVLEKHQVPLVQVNLAVGVAGRAEPVPETGWRE